MCRIGGLLVVAAMLGAMGCADAGSRDADALRGVSDDVAANVCAAFFDRAQALRDAQSTLAIDQVDDAAAGYEGLAADARRAGAKAFARELSDAAGAAHDLARHARDAKIGQSSGGAPAPSSEQSQSLAVLLTMTAKLQLPETRMSLACYSRGNVPFRE